ncbi:hypothetical protein QRO08_09785 [Paracidovorax citrulli]|uniref:Uncharacterized protein n=2 Tax=Paracidovorax citrulli TaxID=80869 RepID=A1TPQ4_PARC0|nr:hypothetical protein [Paracidovorax citrulli]ABM32942.1 hypothetical protein Aave_2367 [Paracidovorax citrulli AAC00-1]ATG93089.1 hypothetical protein CQB05_02710 [Paracidovorax citrulli]MVT36776.1 hypothetical protein [Paracidovorax citrulli]PVY67162.1 hypothetical protein C8E08_4597 [Paracidovorax citrulli]REG68675.1 hypothetical protein C8E07_1794 [Paracidovorax citrulli]
MLLLTALPARKTGELTVRTDDGTAYVFKGTPLSCEVQDEDHVDELQIKGFQTKEEFDAEQKFQQVAAKRAERIAEREAKKAQAAQDDDDDDVPASTGDGLPKEDNTAPTGRVRKAGAASLVKG